MIRWTEYMKYRIQLRGFDAEVVKRIVQFSEERYLDTASRRLVAVGKHGRRLALIAYEKDGDLITPRTIHATTRQ